MSAADEAEAKYPYICVIANRIVRAAEEWITARHADWEEYSRTHVAFDWEEET